MRKLVFLFSLIALAYCRPEPPGYNYSQPLTSYGTPVVNNDLNIDNYKPDTVTNDNQLPIIHKHVYVHIPPPEDEEEHQIKRPVPPPQKHYKIIFIKAPEESSRNSNMPVLPQNEERTFIYLLVKKPDDDYEVSTPASSTPPNKPEVYYIRYKTKLDHVSGDYNGINPIVADVARSSIGHVDRQRENVIGTTALISGGSISDALLGAGTIDGLETYSTTTDASTQSYTVPEVTGPY